MGMELKARLESAASTARTGLGARPDAGELQRWLFEQGVHGVDAVLVTMQVLGVGFDEANAAYLACPLRAADRELQDRLMGAVESVT